jgi:NAD(P)-dependent dehydrogenase (short-subunit alcohol dehydrogenase family)
VTDVFVDKVAIVTGAASGIGTATARRLAGLGAKVIVIDLNDRAVRAVADEIGAGIA